MPNSLLLLPDFLLIGAGFLLCRYTAFDRTTWEHVERLVYYLLFPILLFNSIVRSPLQPAQDAAMVSVGVGVTLAGIAMAYALRRMPGVDARMHASGAQVAFRFNSYVALALAERLGGAPGLVWMALLLGVCVPLVNVAAVWPLARDGGQGYVQAIIRNPLILATVAGLVVNAAGVRFAEPVAMTLQRIGVAALPLGLMAVGAGLRLGSLRRNPAFTSAVLALRHAVLPALGIGLALGISLPAAQRDLVVLFAALPTASSAYVLATRMGGDGPYVAGLVTASTLLGMLSVPLWLAVLASLAPGG